VKLACSRCGQMSEDGHLWCPQADCPAGSVPTVFTYGDYVGDIKIIRLLRVFRTAAIYEAERESLNESKRRSLLKRLSGEDEDPPRVLLKVAHTGNEEILKKEADLLARLAPKRIPGLPIWQPAYVPSTAKDPKYGKAVFRGETRYYLVFDHIQGTFLRDLLYENPEPWYRDAAWITIGVARTISELHNIEKVVHANINPDLILISRNEKTRVPYPILLDLGVMYSGTENMDTQRVQQIRKHLSPAYMAPEVDSVDEYGNKVQSLSLSNTTDVYGLGLLFYEMLAGKPAYPFALRSDGEIIGDIQNQKHSIPAVDRRDVPFVEETKQVIQSAISKKPEQRGYKTVGEFRRKLIDYFGDVPVSVERTWSNVFTFLWHGAILAAGFLALGFTILILLRLLGL